MHMQSPSQSLISRLPAYLTVQFVRFQYKGKEGINAKVLKDIKFPIDFDAFELCTPELQEKLAPMRTKFKDMEESELERNLKGKNKSKAQLETEKPKTIPQPYCFENGEMCYCLCGDLQVLTHYIFFRSGQ